MGNTKTRASQRRFAIGLAIVFVVAFIALRSRTSDPKLSVDRESPPVTLAQQNTKRGAVFTPVTELPSHRDFDLTPVPAVATAELLRPDSPALSKVKRSNASPKTEADTPSNQPNTSRALTPLERITEIRRTMPPGREYGPEPEPEGPATQSPLARGSTECHVDPPDLPVVHTGKRALIVYSLTHREKGVVHTVEMDNFAFFAQHGLLPAGFKTTLFTQVDYAVVRVASSDGAIHECSRRFRKSNIRVLVLPAGPCDICSLARTLKYLGVSNVSEKYAYVVSINSGTRGPFFTMPPKSDGGLPFTWVDHMALGGARQFSETVITAAASSMHLITHFQTYAFGLPTQALGAMGPFFAATCGYVDKEGCIFTGELLTARAAFNASLRVRSLLHDPDRSFSNESAFEAAITATKIFSPLISRVIKPCRMLFAKFGGETFDQQRFAKSYVESILSQTMAQAAVSNRATIGRDASSAFGRAYFGCPAR